MAEAKGNPTDWVTMKIDPEIFDELGVRDPEQIKLETKIMKKVRQVKKELKNDPDNPEKLNELATYYIDGGNYKDAIDILKKVLSKDNLNGRACKLIGTAYSLSDHEDEAIRELNRAAELLPDDPEIFFNLGGVYMLQEYFPNAVQSFKKVIALDPTDIMAYANLAAAYDMQMMYEEEIMVLKKVLMFSPEDKELRSALSTAYFNASHYEEALNAALCVVEIDEKDPQAYCNLGSCYSVSNMVDEAIGAFNKASELDPEYNLPHTNLGSLYATLGRLEKAIKEFKLAVSLNRSDALAWYNLYNCYKEIGRFEDAQEAYASYEKLMKGMEAGEGDPGSAGENPANIPGGVSQTGGYAGGGDMSGNAPGMETLSDGKKPQ
jgi:Flp pilus assembly protein TadD